MLKSQTVMASSTENILVKDSNLAGLALENQHSVLAGNSTKQGSKDKLYSA